MDIDKLLQEGGDDLNLRLRRIAGISPRTYILMSDPQSAVIQIPREALEIESLIIIMGNGDYSVDLANFHGKELAIISRDMIQSDDFQSHIPDIPTIKIRNGSKLEFIYLSWIYVTGIKAITCFAEFSSISHSKIDNYYGWYTWTNRGVGIRRNLFDIEGMGWMMRMNFEDLPKRIRMKTQQWKLKGSAAVLPILRSTTRNLIIIIDDSYVDAHKNSSGEIIIDEELDLLLIINNNEEISFTVIAQQPIDRIIVPRCTELLTDGSSDKIGTIIATRNSEKIWNPDLEFSSDHPVSSIVESRFRLFRL